MEIAVLSCILGDFDTPVDPPTQTIPFTFHRFTDENFPPITGLTPRLQYRLPKTHGFEMFPGYDYYLWLDGTFTLANKDSLEWFYDHIRGKDLLLFKHPWRKTMREETDHIEEHLRLGKSYITSRYQNGLHKEQLAKCLADPGFVDNTLYTSTAFMYRNTPQVQDFLRDWWYEGSRYFTCDQIVLPYLVWKHKLKISVIEDNQYKFKHLTIASTHE